jgi:Lipid A 3-O-deacylase (PagL)
MSCQRGHHFLFLFLLFASLHLSAQVTQEVAPARNFIEIVGAATLADGSLQGVTKDRRLFVFGAAYSRVLSRHRIVELRFTSELIPMALLREPFLKFAAIQTLASNQFTVMRETYGFGASPLGIELDWLPRRKFQPFFGIEGGFLRFDRNVPDFVASKFNFTVDGRGGVRMALPHERSVSVAFAFEHMSNAYTAHDNPGVDAYNISVTYRIPLRYFRADR